MPFSKKQKLSQEISTDFDFYVTEGIVFMWQFVLISKKNNISKDKVGTALGYFAFFHLNYSREGKEQSRLY